MIKISVDVVEPNKALVTGPEFSAYIGFSGGQGYVELVEWDGHETGFYERLPKGLSQDKRYRHAVELLMAHLFVASAEVEVDYEFQRRSGLPQHYVFDESRC